VLSKLGYHVIASTGRMSEAAYLKSLGAAEVIDRNEAVRARQGAGQGALAGGVDSVGSTTARQPAVDDEVWWRRRCLRARRRHGSAVVGRPFYFTRECAFSASIP